MSYPNTVTFQSMVQDASASELPLYVDAAAFTAATRFKYKSFANTAISWIWRTPNRMFAWDWSISTVTATITDGFFPWSTIENSDWFNLWAQDPRPFPIPTASVNWPGLYGAVKAYQDGSGIYPQANLATVFAFFRRAQPKFTMTKVVGGTTYAAGSVVYDEDATGDCYVALVSALGSDISDPAKWARQLIPECIGNIMQTLIVSQLRDTNKSDESASIAYKEAQNWLDLEMERQLPRFLAGPPWAFNSNGLNNSR